MLGVGAGDRQRTAGIRGTARRDRTRHSADHGGTRAGTGGAVQGRERRCRWLVARAEPARRDPAWRWPRVPWCCWPGWCRQRRGHRASRPMVTIARRRAPGRAARSTQRQRQLGRGPPPAAASAWTARSTPGAAGWRAARRSGCTASWRRSTAIRDTLDGRIVAALDHATGPPRRTCSASSVTRRHGAPPAGGRRDRQRDLHGRHRRRASSDWVTATCGRWSTCPLRGRDTGAARGLGPRGPGDRRRRAARGRPAGRGHVALVRPRGPAGRRADRAAVRGRPTGRHGPAGAVPGAADAPRPRSRPTRRSSSTTPPVRTSARWSRAGAPRCPGSGCDSLRLEQGRARCSTLGCDRRPRRADAEGASSRP